MVSSIRLPYQLVLREKENLFLSLSENEGSKWAGMEMLVSRHILPHPNCSIATPLLYSVNYKLYINWGEMEVTPFNICDKIRTSYFIPYTHTLYSPCFFFFLAS